MYISYFFLRLSSPKLIHQRSRQHAICDQLGRAAGSMLENIALASAAYSAEYSTQGEGIDKAHDKARDKEGECMEGSLFL